ncbi:MAG: peptidoglycan DD-metalloendopeptidase family protein, partial [Bacteriovoracia bacterium]
MFPENSLTVVLIPEKSPRYRRFSIPMRWLRRAMWLGAVGLVLALILSLDYWSSVSQVEKTRDIRIENRHLRQQIQEYRSRIDHARFELDQLDLFAQRLRVIADLKDKGSAPAVPVGDLSSNARPAPRALAWDRLEPELDETYRQMLRSEETLHELYELLIEQKAYFAALPTRKPAIGYFTSGFGVRDAPIGGTTKMHEGVDIANHSGTTIRATADGLVSFSGIKGGYGNIVVLDHGYGLETWYGHLRKILIKRDQTVKRGQPIALMGSSGQSTGPHEHYEVRVNKIPVDPLSYIL